MFKLLQCLIIFTSRIRFQNDLIKILINNWKIYSIYQGCHFTWKPGKTLKNLEFEKLKKKTGKTWKCDQNTCKNLEFLIILTFSVLKFQFDTKNLLHK